jgi:hypothetical protein
MKKHDVNDHGAILNWYKEHKKTIDEEGGGSIEREKKEDNASPFHYWFYLWLKPLQIE